MKGTLNVMGLPEGNVVGRALWWACKVDQFLIADIDLLLSLPDKVTLVILPLSDPELCVHNLTVARKNEYPTVYVELEQQDGKLTFTPLLQGEPRTFQAPV